MKWSEAYAIGEANIDEQHKMLFKMAGDFRMALEEKRGEQTYGLLLEFLESYFRNHFKYEEQCMEEYKCPIADKNRADHQQFLAVYDDFRRRFTEQGYQPGNARELIDIVEDWLKSHIGHIDLQLRSHLTKWR